MAQIIPNHSWLRGVCITTVSPQQKQLYFLPALLSGRGDLTRNAKKAYFDHEKQAPAEGEAALTQDYEKAHQNLLIIYLCESLKQQYKLKLQPGESGDDSATLFRDAMLDLLVDGDLERILTSLEYGKELTRPELIELTKEMAEKK